MDSLGGVFVADPSDGLVAYVSPTCAKKTITKWSTDEIIASPQSIAIFNGGLYVADSGLHKIWFITLNSDYSLGSAADSRLTNTFVAEIAVSSDGMMFLVEQGRSLVAHDLFGLRRISFTGLDQVASISKLLVDSKCGLFFSATGNNQIWRCDNLDTQPVCQVYCEHESGGCLFLQDPTGIAAGEHIRA